MQVELTMVNGKLESLRQAQRMWAARPIGTRLVVIRELRIKMASRAAELARSVPCELPGALNRSVADTLVSEVLPLMEACRFLERSAAGILHKKRPGLRGRPVWLRGVGSEVERVPWGVVLVLGAANYPLFLAGVQTIQALAAGNAVLWKPAPGTEGVALALQGMLTESGLDTELLTVLDSGVEAAQEAMAAGVDFVVLTGSAQTGRAILRQLAETLTPSAMELSGCDAVFVLPGADWERAAKAIGFGLRFNGSFTCMGPRRVFLAGLAEVGADAFERRLKEAVEGLTPVNVPARTRRLLQELTEDARTQGAEVALGGVSESGPVAGTLILRANPEMRAMRTDVFAPVLSVMRTAGWGEALAANAACPYALTASIFGPEREARSLASQLRVGHVTINDLIAPTADPRVSFGGRGRSGFGVTRGAEGLLAMTTPRTVQVQRSRSTRAYDAAGEQHVEFFAGLAEMLHGRGLGERWSGLKRLVGAARKLG